MFACGKTDRLDELKSIIPADVELETNTTHPESAAGMPLHTYNLIIDLNFDEDQQNLAEYLALFNRVILCGAVKRSLTDVLSPHRNRIESTFIGLNTLPTFINRSRVEVSFTDLKHIEILDPLAKNLNWQYLQVEDRVGMVSPRIVCMIINEACNTVLEGTATKEDVDKGMLLGTAYPLGPLAWADKIGIQNVYDTLEAIYNDTHDTRYKISPLLKRMCLRGERFYENN